MASLSAAVVIDWSTLVERLARKHAPPAARAADLTSRMDGGCIGPLDPADVEAMLCDSAIGRVVTGPDSEPIDVGRARRLFPAAIRRAIVARDQHCRWPGCEKPPGWCEAHHTEAWEHGGDTSVATGILLCTRHHHFLHAHPTWTFDWDQIHFRVFRPDGTRVARMDRRGMGRHASGRPPAVAFARLSGADARLGDSAPGTPGSGAGRTHLGSASWPWPSSP